MYTKLFSKIIHSSIWLQPTPTRIVWLTMLALSDQDGFVALSTIGNVANAARVTDEEAHAAVTVLENPEENTIGDDHQGRRIERVPGGWVVLNYVKYRDLATAEKMRQQSRERSKRYRDSRRHGKITQPSRRRHAKITLSEAYAEAEAETESAVDQEQRADALRVLVKLAHQALKSSPSDAKDELKSLAAKHRILYDATLIQKALDSAERQAEKG